MKIEKRFEVVAFKECPVTGESKHVESDFNSLKLARQCAKVALENHFSVTLYAWEDSIDDHGHVVEATRIAIHEPMTTGWEVTTL
tara:strand:- start:5727 stop:5981 length:255 start_codon:yes stop_codon:yes gene_type:complete